MSKQFILGTKLSKINDKECNMIWEEFCDCQSNEAKMHCIYDKYIMIWKELYERNRRLNEIKCIDAVNLSECDMIWKDLCERQRNEDGSDVVNYNECDMIWKELCEDERNEAGKKKCDHYKQCDLKVVLPDGSQKDFEIIDLINSCNFNFNLGNALKYIARCNYKGHKKEDLEKAIWYIQSELSKATK